MPSRAAVRHLAGLSLLAASLLLSAAPARAAQAEITSAGPLTRIIISDELNCQVAHRDDVEFELFGGEIGACGTLLALDGALFGPSSLPAASGIVSQAWTPVSQLPVSGRGTAADPFRIVTVVAAGDTGLRIEQTDSYVVGEEAYRTDVRVLNAGGEQRSAILYRAGDCFLQESDEGFGRVDNGAPACITERAPGSRIEQWLPLTPGSRYMEGGFGEVWAHVGSQQPFPNTCRCDELTDNGAGLSWPVSLGPGETALISHETFFSPLGRASAAQSFRESVPAPTEISLDPIVIVQSLLITAGVILLMPFPAALFNETFEANNDRVRAGLAGIRARGGRLLRGAGLAVGRSIAAVRRPPSQPPPHGGSAAAPAAEPNASPAAPAAASETPGRRWPALGADFWRTPHGILAFIVPSALVYSFLDPTFALSLESLATLAGLIIGFSVVIAAYGIPMVVFARVRGISVAIEALPVTLLIGVAFVVLSRVAQFEPGYVYGLVIGALFAREVTDDQQGRAEAVGAASLLVVAGLAWVSLLFLPQPTGSADLGRLAFETAAVAVAVAGVEGVLFAMLPLRFMPGGAVFAWDRRVWAVLIGVGVFGFAHVLLNPLSGYLAEATRDSFLSMLALFVGFALVSVLFWAWFRFRPTPAPVVG